MTLISDGLIGDFPFAIRKHDTIGHLCGYLGIPENHPWYNKKSYDIDAYVHGGLTFSDKNDGYPTNQFEGNIWWVGFDCAHAEDYISGEASIWHILNGDTLSTDNLHIWTRDEVFEELVKLSEQAYNAALLTQLVE